MANLVAESGRNGGKSSDCEEAPCGDFRPHECTEGCRPAVCAAEKGFGAYRRPFVNGNRPPALATDFSKGIPFASKAAEKHDKDNCLVEKDGA
ncbi:MAG: hypothetical protein MJZ81_08480 [Bacteroidales bacterium]|nr:hypothetical protein [Bacteroidales bacterium]